MPISETAQLPQGASERWADAVFPACGLIVILSALRGVFAAGIDLRIDEAYYWTWSKEDALSFIDYPPMVAWFIRSGAALFGDTPFGVRFAGLAAMLGMQVLLGDIVRRRTRSVWPVVFVLLAPEAALYYGQMMALVMPEIPLVLFLSALLWTLVRLEESRDPRWWLLVGIFGGLMLLSKYTALLVVPAVLAFALWPPRNRMWLRTIWPWLAAGIAVAVFSPVLIWNAQHDWASFKFQFVRALVQPPFSLSTIGDFIGLQFGLVGPVLLPVLAVGAGMAAWQGYRRGDAVLILLTTAASVPFLYFLWRSTSLRIDTTWPTLIWPPAFAAAAINLDDLARRGSRLARSAMRWAFVGIGTGIAAVALVSAYYLFGTKPLLGRFDPIGRDAGYGELSKRVASAMQDTGATWIAATEYRTYSMLRWQFRDRVPVIEINERSRFLDFRPPDLSRIEGHAGLWVVPRTMKQEEIWASAGARLDPAGTIERTWRGLVFDVFDLAKITQWTPDLNPPVGSPLYLLSAGWQLASSDGSDSPNVMR